MDNPDKALISIVARNAQHIGMAGVGASALVTLFYLVSMADENGVVENQSRNEIAIETGQSITTIEKHLRIFRDKKLVEIEKVFDPTCGWRNRYNLKDIAKRILELAEQNGDDAISEK